MRTAGAWIRRRARRLMAAFGVKRSKAVRYASDDWKAFAGRSRLSCAGMGVCQDRPECVQCPTPVATRIASREARDFRRFLTQVKGEAS